MTGTHGIHGHWKLLFKLYCMCMYKCTYNIFYTITSSVREEICDENSANKNSNNSKVCVLLTRIKKKKFYTQDQTICLRFKVKFESQVTASRLWATYHIKSHGKKMKKKKSLMWKVSMLTQSCIPAAGQNKVCWLFA